MQESKQQYEKEPPDLQRVTECVEEVESTDLYTLKEKYVCMK